VTLASASWGLSEGNGHPFSFSAIVNGYDDAGMADSGWPGIHAYLRQRDASEFGGLGMRVTHAWTQDPAIDRGSVPRLPHPHAVERPEAMIGRGRRGAPRPRRPRPPGAGAPLPRGGPAVFVDKPLTLDLASWRAFRPYLASGQLMSCSGMRFARELDERARRPSRRTASCA
jgi:hypothetical protein